MKICDTKDHGEIVFEGRDCEACETIKGLQKEGGDLREELQAAYKTIEELEVILHA